MTVIRVTFFALALGACSKSGDKTAPQPEPRGRAQSATPTPPTGPRSIDIAVTKAGFEPDRIPVQAGQPLDLVVTRKTDDTCAKEIVIKDLGINQPLALGQPVHIAVTPSKAGEIRYACAMDMHSGILVVQ